MRIATWLTGGVLLLALELQPGCTAPARIDVPVMTQSVAVSDDAQRDGLWMASQEVLRENGFRLDRVNRRAGIISTYPVTSQHFFEFWRHDVDTPYDFWEATLKTVRRSVILDIAFDESTNAAEVTIAVRREQFSTPERQFNNSIAAFRMFNNQLPEERTGQPITTADDYWIDDGRDPAMERYLLHKILSRAGGA